MDKNRFAKYGFIGALALVGIVAGYAFLNRPTKKLNPKDPVTAVREVGEVDRPLENIVNREFERTGVTVETQPASQPYVESRPTTQATDPEPPEELIKILQDPQYLAEKAKSNELDLYLRNNILSLWRGKFPRDAEYRPFSDGSEMMAYAQDVIRDEEGNPLRRVAKITYESNQGNLEVQLGQPIKGGKRVPSSITLLLSSSSGRARIYVNKDGKRIELDGENWKPVSKQTIPFQHPESWQSYADLFNLVDY